MLNIEEIKTEIVKRLLPLEPDKIILFGSYAYGNPTDESDIDLYVVTKDDFMPKSFEEKMNVKMKISQALYDLEKIVDFDIVTHTKAMHKKFIQMDSMFSRKILQNGIGLL
ncbi:nucleotidyltransferase domain-containing protein [Sulfurimonas sp.]